jgi:RNA polymerase sigma-70 factor (ECF subfamily)
VDQRTDSELVIAARLGDKAAFGHLVDRHLPMARRLAMRMIGNQEIAWELAQAAYLQAYLSLDKLREPASFLSWQHGIVRNVCRSHLRSPNLLVGLVHDERSLVAHL